MLRSKKRWEQLQLQSKWLGILKLLRIKKITNHSFTATCLSNRARRTAGESPSESSSSSSSSSLEWAGGSFAYGSTSPTTSISSESLSSCILELLSEDMYSSVSDILSLIPKKWQTLKKYISALHKQRWESVQSGEQVLVLGNLRFRHRRAADWSGPIKEHYEKWPKWFSIFNMAVKKGTQT